MTANPPQEYNKVSTLFEVEKSIRAATSLSSLGFVIVNQTNRLISFEQAVLISLPDSGASPRIQAISSVASVERTAPFVHWVEKIAKQENKESERLVRHMVSPKNLSQADHADWDSLSPPHVLWLPLISPVHGAIGVLWLSRQTPWNDDKEFVLIDHIGLSYAHALQVFQKNQSLSKIAGKLLKRPVALVIAVILMIAMMLPVTMTALGSAEVVPVAPFVVTSPTQGVVKEIVVESNQAITAGQVVAWLDDREMRNRVAVAAKAIEVAIAQLKRAERAAFVDPQISEALAELEAQVDLRQVELEFAREQLKQAALVAGKDGVAVVTRPEQWMGRPVSLGERILMVADPEHVELDIMLPVKDVILLEPGNRVRFFLDSDPLTPEEARIIRFEYEPHLTESGSLAYTVTAEFTDTKTRPRIGLRGTAKIYGRSVTLFYHIFRRPLMAIRQWWGG
jgi:multidrug resistance efflux pump